MDSPKKWLKNKPHEETEEILGALTKVLAEKGIKAGLTYLQLQQDETGAIENYLKILEDKKNHDKIHHMSKELWIEYANNEGDCTTKSLFVEGLCESLKYHKAWLIDLFSNDINKTFYEIINELSLLQDLYTRREPINKIKTHITESMYRALLKNGSDYANLNLEYNYKLIIKTLSKQDLDNRLISTINQLLTWIEKGISTYCILNYFFINTSRYHNQNEIYIYNYEWNDKLQTLIKNIPFLENIIYDRVLINQQVMKIQTSDNFTLEDLIQVENTLELAASFIAKYNFKDSKINIKIIEKIREDMLDDAFIFSRSAQREETSSWEIGRHSGKSEARSRASSSSTSIDVTNIKILNTDAHMPSIDRNIIFLQSIPSLLEGDSPEIHDDKNLTSIMKRCRHSINNLRHRLISTR